MNYVLMSFLMFSEYQWKEFDEELKRAQEQPGDYEINYFLKVPDKVELAEYREAYYTLSLDERTLLTSYNAIGRKRKISNAEDIQHFNSKWGYSEIVQRGYLQEIGEDLHIEFPVTKAGPNKSWSIRKSWSSY